MLIYIITFLLIAAFILIPTTVEGFDLLNGMYKIKPEIKLNDASYRELYKLYPRYPAKSEKNNNIKHWKHPSNGTCIPSDICQTIYQSS